MPRGIRFLIPPLLAGLALVLSLVLGAPAASAARPLATGVTVPDVGTPDQLAYNRIKKAGASYTRIAISWRQVAPTEKPAQWNPTDPADPHYNWGVPDQQLERAVKAGLTPIIQINSAPGWAERC
jgi:hypothetical protein